ncbi:hypothetical protein M3Y96_00447600 [Aphelenchoides besseyi]|nr:hypothetical protein M3Y96_00447600 [Aphelenchoides besseyi]
MFSLNFSLSTAMGKSFGSGAIVCIMVLLIAGMVEAKCLDGKKITGACKDFSLQVKSDSDEIKATMKIKENVGGTMFRGNITIGRCTIGGQFLDGAVFSADGGDAYKSPINIVANSDTVTMQQGSEVPKMVCSTSPFEVDDNGEVSTTFAVHTDRADFVKFELDSNVQVVSSNEAKTNYWIAIGIPVGVSMLALVLSSLVGFAFYRCEKNTKKQEGSAKKEKLLVKGVVTPLANKETPKSNKTSGWLYAKNAEIARSSRLREITRRKSLPGRQSLRQIQRSIHQKNSANALKKMMAAKAKRDDLAKKVAAAKANREITKKIAESLNKELVNAKADFETKKKVNAEIAALDATTPKVKSNLAQNQGLDKKRSKTNNVDVSFDINSAFKTLGFSFEEFLEFLHLTTVFISCRLPYSVKSNGSISTKNTLYRWPITDFEFRFNVARFGTSWQSDEFEVPKFEYVKFSVGFYPRGQKGCADFCGFLLEVENLAGYSNLSIQFDFLFENTDSTARFPLLKFIDT